MTLEIYNIILLKSGESDTVEQQHLLVFANNFIEAQIKANGALDRWGQLGWKLYGVFHVDRLKLERGEVLAL